MTSNYTAVFSPFLHFYTKGNFETEATKIKDMCICLYVYTCVQPYINFKCTAQ